MAFINDSLFSVAFAAGPLTVTSVTSVTSVTLRNQGQLKTNPTGILIRESTSLAFYQLRDYRTKISLCANHYTTSLIYFTCRFIMESTATLRFTFFFRLNLLRFFSNRTKPPLTVAPLRENVTVFNVTLKCCAFIKEGVQR